MTKILKFPEDIGTIPPGGSPTAFCKITLVKYYHQNFVFDYKDSASMWEKYGQMSMNNNKRIELGWHVILPLPNNVDNRYSPQWEMANTRLASAVTDSEGILDMASEVSSVFAATFFERFQKIFSGRTLNPRKQALFNAIEPRTFSFSWNMSPQTEKEAETIQEIVRVLSTYSLPKQSENKSQFEFPAEFEVTFHNVKGFPKISTCVCTGITSNVTPNTVQLFKSGHPIQTNISLSFLETELRTQDSPGV